MTENYFSSGNIERGNEITGNGNVNRSRPSSASSNKRSSLGNPYKNKANKLSSEVSPDNYATFHLSREELICELQEAKVKNTNYETIINSLKVENSKLEKEVHRQQLRLDKLLNSTAGPTGTGTGNGTGPMRGNIPLDWKKDIEKNHLIRQFKKQINELRHELMTKDGLLENERKSQKTSNLLVLAYERDEYYVEIQRLQVIIKDLKEELILEKQRKEVIESHKHVLLEESLRQEIKNLTIKYNNILESLTEQHHHDHHQQQSKQKIKMEREQIKINERYDQYINNLTSGVKATHNNRPQSAGIRRKKSQTHPHHRGGEEDDTSSVSNKPSKLKKKISSIKEFQQDIDDILEQTVKENMNSSGSNLRASSPPHYTLPKRSTPTMEAPQSPLVKPQSKPINSSNAHFAMPTASSSSSNPTSPHPSQPIKNTKPIIISSPGVGAGGTPAATGHSTSHFTTASTSFTAIPTAPQPNITPVLLPSHGNNNGNTTDNNNLPPVNSARKADSYKFKLNDKVDCKYYNGETYYPGTVVAVHPVPGSNTATYDIIYDDDDRETKVIESNIKLSGAPEPAKSPLPAVTAPVAVSVTPFVAPPAVAVVEKREEVPMMVSNNVEEEKPTAVATVSQPIEKPLQQQQQQSVQPVVETIRLQEAPPAPLKSQSSEKIKLEMMSGIELQDFNDDMDPHIFGNSDHFLDDILPTSVEKSLPQPVERPSISTPVAVAAVTPAAVVSLPPPAVEEKTVPTVTVTETTATLTPSAEVDPPAPVLEKKGSQSFAVADALSGYLDELSDDDESDDNSALPTYGYVEEKPIAGQQPPTAEKAVELKSAVAVEAAEDDEYEEAFEDES